MDSNTGYNEKKSRLLIVPWYDKKEWLETYKGIYSDDAELQEQSYNQMCIWKARYPNLPLGVECTMSMLHVRLCDSQVEATPTFKEKDLQLLYSTAVMRFLNHLSVMSNCKDSMYKMAKQQNIPDWLINLRHEAAHGNSLPALYLLRQASEIIMQWLRTYYWETEAEVMEDFIVNRKENREAELLGIRQMLDLWLNLKVIYWSGCSFIDDILDQHVREKAKELAAEKALAMKRSADAQKKKDSKKTKFTHQASEGDEIETFGELQEESSQRLKSVFNPLLKKLFDPLKEKKSKKIKYQDSLIECLVKHPGFCPQIKLDELTETEVLQLMSLQGNLWKEIVEKLQAHSLLSSLMSALMREQHELISAHMWLRLFTYLLSKDIPHQKPGTQALCNLLADSLPCDVDPQVLILKANYLMNRPPINLKPPSAKEVDVLHDLAQKVLANPTRFSSKYLKSLLNFWETPLRSDTKENLCAAADIYVNHKIHKTHSSKVYTLASLLDHGLIITQSELSVPEEDTEDISPWKVYSGDADWSKCALGTLPWQQTVTPSVTKNCSDE